MDVEAAKRNLDFVEGIMMKEECDWKGGWLPHGVTCPLLIALEWALKGYLLACGLQDREVRNLGHDLRKALSEASACGLNRCVADELQPVIDLIDRADSEQPLDFDRLRLRSTIGSVVACTREALNNAPGAPVRFG